MTPDRLTRRQLFEIGLEKAKQTALVATILTAACAPSAPPASEIRKDGWQHFISGNHPYEIDFPPAWTVGKQQVGGKIQDIFNGEVAGGFQTNIIVASEPTSQSFDQYSSKALSDLSELMYKSRGGAGGPGAGGYDTKIAGQKASVLHAAIPKGTLLINPDLEYRVAVFVKDGRGWNIILACVPSVIGTEEPKFNRMFASFKFK